MTNDSLPLDWQRVLIDRIADAVPPFKPEPHPIRAKAASDGRR